MPPRNKSDKVKSRPSLISAKRIVLDKESEEYMKRRERNNVAVRRSRDKSRRKAAETMKLVAKLRHENEDLEQKVKLLSKELSLLRDLFLTHANNKSTCDNGKSEVEVNKDALQKDHEYTVSRISLGRNIKTEVMKLM